MTVEILRWWLVIELLGLVGWPLSIWLFRRLPDQGVSWSKAIGLLLTGYGAWLLSSIGMGSFSFALICFVALLVAGLGVWACRRSAIDLRTVFREQRWWWAFTEGLFAAGLLVGLLLRLHSPWGSNIGHTEMQMDFAFLNGILASPSFPPQDPWLSGYPINYYYFGYVLIALLTRLSGLSSAITFTLALPAIFGLTTVGVAGLVWNATGLFQHQRTASNEPAETAEPEEIEPTPPVPSRRSIYGRLAAATLGPILVLLMANQMAALMFITGTQQVTSYDASQLATALRQSLAGEPKIVFDQPTPQMPGDVSDWSGVTEVIRQPGKQVGDVFWWPTRAVWDTREEAGQLRRNYAITEFPIFSFMLGDMHPHVLSLPWTILALALALNLMARRELPSLLHKLGRLELVLSGIILGSLYAINSWDLPTYVLLYLGSLLLVYAWLAPEPGKIAWKQLALQAAAVLAAAYVLWLPFYWSFTSLVGSEGFPLGPAPGRTGLHAFVLIFGLFFIPLFALLVSSGQTTQPAPTFGIVQSARRMSLPSLPFSWPIITALALVAGLLLNWPLFWLMPMALWAISTAYLTNDRSRSVVLMLLAIGALVLWGTDVVYIRDVFNSRMNTIFKFFYQVWLIWGTAAAAAIWLLLRRFRFTALAWLVPFVILLIGASFYAALAPNWKPVEPTLNGLIHIDREQPGDSKAIAWIKANTPGSAVILEAPDGGYNSRKGLISMATGRSTIIGWRGHESQWRGGQPEILSQLDTRVNDAALIYTAFDPEEAQPLLDKYNVDYVYVSARERELLTERGAPPSALDKFPEFMDVVYNADGVVIYKRR